MGGLSFPALRIRNYRLFAAGQLVSVTGTGCSASPRTGSCSS